MPRLPVGEAQSSVLLNPSAWKLPAFPRRRVYPSAISATIFDADIRCELKRGMQRPSGASRLTFYLSLGSFAADTSIRLHSRLLLRETMERSQTPYQISAIDRHNISAWETFLQDGDSFLVSRGIESRY